MESLIDPQPGPRRYTVLAACGCGHDGRLGLGDPRHPQTILSTSDITLVPFFLEIASSSYLQNVDAVRSVHCGGYHTIAWTKKGILYGWGVNDDGQLGLGSGEGGHGKNTCYSKPTRLNFFDDLYKSFCAAKANNGEPRRETLSSSFSSSSRTSVDDDPCSFILDVSCGAYHSMVLTRSGLYVCGRNTFGQLGLGKEISAVYEWTEVRALFAPGRRLLDRLVVPVNHNNSSASEDALLSFFNLDSSSSSSLSHTTGRGQSSIILRQGELTHISCGTHHSLLAFRNAALERRGDESSARRGKDIIEFYPILILASGKGDYGELGYDGDVFAILSAKEKRQEAALLHEAKRFTMQGGSQLYDDRGGGNQSPGEIPLNGYTSAKSGSSSGTECFSNGWWKTKRKKERRPEFFSLQFLPVVFEQINPLVVKIPRDASTPTSSANSFTDEHVMVMKALTSAAPPVGVTTESRITTLPPSEAKSILTQWRVSSMKAMHLHSTVTLQDHSHNADTKVSKRVPQHQVWHWGCYYCNEVEGLESSIPIREVRNEEGTEHSGTSPSSGSFSLHAANEVLYRYRCSPLSSPSSSEAVLESKGSGALVGVGDEDAFETEWRSICPPHGSHVRHIEGRNHVLLLVERRSSNQGSTKDGIPPADISSHCDPLCTPVPPSTTSTTEVWGIGDNLHGQLGKHDKDLISAPIPVLRPGDAVALPSSAVVATAVDDAKVNDNSESMWEVLRIRSVAAGVNHSMFLVDVMQKESEEKRIQ